MVTDDYSRPRGTESPKELAPSVDHPVGNSARVTDEFAVENWPGAAPDIAVYLSHQDTCAL